MTGDRLLTWWEGLEDWRAAPDATAPARLQVRLGALPTCFETAIERLQKPQMLFPQGARWCADYVHGQIIAHLPLASPQGEGIGAGVRDWLVQLRQQARDWHGYCEVVCAPASLRHELDMWGDHPGTALLRRYKQQFDPHAVLNPGRYVAGL
jgi:hypothetical protein